MARRSAILGALVAGLLTLLACGSSSNDSCMAGCLCFTTAASCSATAGCRWESDESSSGCVIGEVDAAADASVDAR